MPRLTAPQSGEGIFKLIKGQASRADFQRGVGRGRIDHHRNIFLAADDGILAIIKIINSDVAFLCHEYVRDVFKIAALCVYRLAPDPQIGRCLRLSIGIALGEGDVDAVGDGQVTCPCHIFQGLGSDGMKCVNLAIGVSQDEYIFVLRNFRWRWRDIHDQHGVELERQEMIFASARRANPA